MRPCLFALLGFSLWLMPGAVQGQDLQIRGKIVFTSNRDGNYEIYVMDADGSNQTRLTNSAGLDIDPSWSPDGTRIAFTSDRDGNREIYAMNADGTGQTNLSNNGAADGLPFWSPDATKIVFYSSRDGNTEIYVMNADGSSQTRLTNSAGEDENADWSPDGTKIAFASMRDGNREIYVMNADGSSQTRLTNSAGNDVDAAWSPNGAKIAFSSIRDGTQQLYVMNADGSSQTRLTNNAVNDWEPIWSAEGSRIAFRRDSPNNEVFVVNTDGTGSTDLSNNAGSESYPSWGEALRHIGSAGLGGSVSRTLTIDNKGASTLSVTNITSSDGQFTISPTSFSVALSGSQSVTVTFAPTSTGTKYSTLTITSNDPDTPSAILTINGRAIQFTDVTLSAGVNDAGNGVGIAWGDYDGDGDLDFYMSNYLTANSLYRNNGSGTFTEVGASAGVNDGSRGRGVSWGDYDSDGDLDLYLANDNAANKLYRNDGSGTFAEVGASAGANANATSYSPSWGDYDADGDLDLSVVTGTTNLLYRNNGNGTFTEVGASAGVNSSGSGQQGVWGDYDGDSDLDLYVTNSGSANRLYRNNGNGTFTEVGASAGVNNNGNGAGASWGDYDTDGDLDLYVSNSNQAALLYRNNGNGTFTEVGASAGVNNNGNGQGVGWADYDNDGDLDLLLVNYQNANLLYRNNGNGTFTDVGASEGVNVNVKSQGAAWSDYDGDGDLDFYVAIDGADKLFKNNGNSNRWLVFKTVGTASNKNGIGAKVTATVGSTTQRRDVDGGSGLWSQPSLPVEFGFGSTTTVDQVVVSWPSGNTNTLTSVATNQSLTVTELTTAALSSPADGATGQAVSPTFSWGAVSGANSYRLQVSTASNFASTVYDNASVAGTSQAVGALSVLTTYYWRVRANNANSSGSYSGARSFVTAPNTAPTLAAIADPAAISEGAGTQTVSLAGIGAGGGESQTLTVAATSSNTALIPNPTVSYTSPNTTGSLGYTPVSAAYGTATITVTVTDDGGTANGGVNTTSRSFAVTVNPVNTVADLVVQHPNPIYTGEGFELRVLFRNPFGRQVAYTGTVRLEVPLIELPGEGSQTVAQATAVVFSLQTQVWRTADGANSRIPFTLTVEGAGSRTGEFQFRSRYQVPALGLPAVEVRRGEGWVEFADFSFVGGRTEGLRVRSQSPVRSQARLDISYLRVGEQGEQVPAVLYQLDVYLEPRQSREFSLKLPLYQDVPEGGKVLRLFRAATGGPQVRLADGEMVNYGDAMPGGFVEAAFRPAPAEALPVGAAERGLRYGEEFSCGLLFEGEPEPRTFYHYNARQANGASGGHAFAHDLLVTVQDSRLQVVQEGQGGWIDPQQINLMRVVTPEAAKVPVYLTLGPLHVEGAVEIEALPNQPPQARILQVQVREQSNFAGREWRDATQAAPEAAVRVQVEAIDPDAQFMGGIREVGVMVAGAVVARQQVEGAPPGGVFFLELGPEVRRSLRGEVELIPFALDARGARVEANPGRLFRFAPGREQVRYVPYQEGHQVFLLPGPRPGSQYVAIGVRVQRQGSGARLVSADMAIAEVVGEDGQVFPPQDYRVVYSNRIRPVRLSDGRLGLVPQVTWDPKVAGGRWTRTSVGVGMGAVGIYHSLDGSRQVDYLFPYVVEVLPAGKAAVRGTGSLEEIQAAMAAWAAQLPPLEELPQTDEQGEEADPKQTELPPNLPNPFNPTTQIPFHLAQEGQVKLAIYNLLGQEVRVLVDRELPAGVYQVEWDGRDARGRELGSGVYLCRLQGAGFQEVRKMLRAR